ncbi:MAG TPA: TerB family tellurite resistance protein [Crocinitomix sp.]|nr:TerB family tellurite resistance protein [Crocinitomix sp.]
MALNPSSKGWIKKYFSLIDQPQLKLKTNSFPNIELSLDELIYTYLQPTGFLYGHPTNFLFLNVEYFKNLTLEETLKILLLEGLVLVNLLKEEKNQIKNVGVLLNQFIDFYEHSNLEKAKKGWLNFSKLDTYGKLESIISQRIELKSNLTSKLFMSNFYNALILHDLVLYQDYLDGKQEAYITEKRCQVTLDLVKVIAIAAYADGEVTDEEKSLFKLFVNSVELNKSQKKIAETFFETPKTINDISFDATFYNEKNSWLLKRHILEIAILTFWSDKAVTEKEKYFLKLLTAKLNLTDEDTDKSYVAIQTFVINNKNDVLFLKGKNDVEVILSRATKRWSKIIVRNKDKIANELKQSKELVTLIRKSTVEDLSSEEKDKIKTQFYDLAKTIPSLTLFMLPGGAIILPLVLKIIPNLIPSAFQENVVDEEE